MHLHEIFSEPPGDQSPGSSAGGSPEAVQKLRDRRRPQLISLIINLDSKNACPKPLAGYPESCSPTGYAGLPPEAVQRPLGGRGPKLIIFIINFKGKSRLPGPHAGPTKSNLRSAIARTTQIHCRAAWGAEPGDRIRGPAELASTTQQAS